MSDPMEPHPEPGPEPLHIRACFACDDKPPVCRFVCQWPSCFGPEGGVGFRAKQDRPAVELCASCVPAYLRNCPWCGRPNDESVVVYPGCTDWTSTPSEASEELLECPSCAQQVHARVQLCDGMDFWCFKCATTFVEHQCHAILEGTQQMSLSRS